MITSIHQLDPNKIYSYADYITWKIEERLEILRGKIVQMAAPSTKHQEISMFLSNVFWQSMDRKTCRVFAAPFDVQILPNTVVQPDLSIVCDLKKLNERGCVGAPDLIVEILSPFNTKIEMKHKFNIYEEAGVREYWVILPQQYLLIYVLDKNKKYRGLRPYTEDDIAKSTLFADLEVDMKTVLA